MPRDNSLLGHWPLATDASDVSPNGNTGRILGAMFVDGAARFESPGAVIEVPHANALDFQRAEFTVAAWVHTDAGSGDILGDILSKYDSHTRTGFTLSALDFPGSVYSTPNSHTLSFGLNDGADNSVWQDCGRPGNALHVFTLCVYDGSLYAGTFETGADEAGRVWRWDGAQGWLDCGAPDGSNTVMSFCVSDGDLYCGTGRYKAEGSALVGSENSRAGGQVFRYLGGTEWENCGRISPDAAEAHSLTSYRGGLYVIPSYTKGVYRRLNDGSASNSSARGSSWEYCGAPGDRRCMTLGVHRGDLYAGGNEYSGVWRYIGGTEWESIGTQKGPAALVEDGYECESQIYSFMTWGGRLHIGTWPSGSVFRYEGGTDWTFCGRLGEEREVMGVAAYNGSFYAGTLPLAQVYRYDGDEDWSVTGRVDHTPGVTYRRAWSMAVYDGRLFCGTLPSGHVWCYRDGDCATVDRWLPSGWRHVTAVRESNRLAVYIDGVLAGESATKPTPRDISTKEPLRIGSGPRDSFAGHIRDVRLYNRALNGTDVAELRIM
jgi:hypothetical protein